MESFFNANTGDILEVDREVFNLLSWLRRVGAAGIGALSRYKEIRAILPTLLTMEIAEFELASDKKARGELLEAFIAGLGKQDSLVANFDKRLWFTLSVWSNGFVIVLSAR